MDRIYVTTMYRFVSMCLVLFMLVSFSGCGDVKTIGKHTYDTHGILDINEKRNPDIEYQLIIGNVVWAILLSETIIAPVYFIGFSLYEPVGKRTNHNIDIGVIR